MKKQISRQQRKAKKTNKFNKSRKSLTRKNLLRGGDVPNNTAGFKNTLRALAVMTKAVQTLEKPKPLTWNPKPHPSQFVHGIGFGGFSENKFILAQQAAKQAAKQAANAAAKPPKI